MAFEFNSEKSNKIKEALKKNEVPSTSEEQTKVSQEIPVVDEKNDSAKTAENAKTQSTIRKPTRKIKENSEESLKTITKIKRKTVREIEKKAPHEFKQRYNIMLDPSVKKKADKIAKEKNFKSTSSFLNELIKNL
jgi:hypothetical protein